MRKLEREREGEGRKERQGAEKDFPMLAYVNSNYELSTWSVVLYCTVHTQALLVILSIS
jgi:hypothetical protein